MLRRIGLAALGILVFALVLVACAPSVPPTPETIVVTQVVEVEGEPVIETVEVEVTPIPEPEQEAAPAPVTEEINLREDGKLTIAYQPLPAVFEVAEDGTVTGVCGLIAEEVAKRMGLEPAYVPFDFPALIPALQSGRVDMLGAGFALTQPRAQILYYLVPWLLQPETSAIRPDFEPFHSWEEAAERNLTLATVVGYYHIERWEQYGINVHTFDSVDACLLDVVNGGADGCSVGTFDVLYRAATQPDSPIGQLKSITIGGPTINADVNAQAVNRDNPALARAISDIMKDMWREGLIEEYYRQTFGDAPIDLFINPPPGHGVYVTGPWEPGVVPPASEIYPEVSTVESGVLTVGVAQNSPLLTLEGDQLTGPEADILAFVAGKLGLELKGVAVDDEAAALNDGVVDLVAGALPATEEASHQYWQSIPVGFNPDYIYVMPDEGGSYPGYTRWEDVVDEGGKLVVLEGSDRIDELSAALGVDPADLITVADPAEALQALVDGTAQGFVGTTIDYNIGASSSDELANAGIGWVRNNNLYSYGEAFIWGVKGGNADLIDALDQGITAAWQQDTISQAYRDAFPGSNVTSLTAPGPTAIGTSFGASKDFVFRNMWVPGPWLQRPGWVEQ
jgi:ABC-type amino acid transport substrate-binding protein